MPARTDICINTLSPDASRAVAPAFPGRAAASRKLAAD